MNRHIVISIIDQMLISAMMFAINLLLIGLAGAENFGRFIVVLSAYFLTFGAQNALILIPVNVLIPGTTEGVRRRYMRMLATVDIAVVGLAAATVAAIVAAIGYDLDLVLVSVCLVIAGASKELQRTVFLTDRRSLRYLAMDAVVILVTGLALLPLWHAMAPETAAIAALALGNLVGALIFGVDLQRSPIRLPAMLNRYGSYWRKTRWALGGAAITDTQMRFYVFAVELLRGSAALGLLQAGRVIINPISMLAFAWARAIRPRMAECLRADDRNAALAMLGSGVFLIAAAGVAYLGALYLSWPLVEAYLIKGRFPGLYDTLLLWSLFAVLNIPSICISIYLQAGHKYRQLAMCSGLSALSSSLLLGVLILGVPSDWAVVALIVGETVMLAGLLKVMRDDLMEVSEHGSFHRSIS